MAAAWTAVSCGGEPVASRPVEVDVQGIGAPARVVALWLEGVERACRDLAGLDVRTLDADARVAWTPDRSRRALRLPETDAEQALLVVYAEDDTGRVTGCACRSLRFADLERPEIVLRLGEGGC